MGPEDPQVYWKRRALVVGAAVAVLLLLFILFRPGGGESGTEAAPAPSPTQLTPSVAPVVPPTPSLSASPSPSLSDGACADTDITVDVTPSEEAYVAGVNPKLTMTITNTGTLTCQRDVGSGANEVLVSSGGVQVWSSDDCNTGSVSDIVALRPGEPASVTVEWPRTNGCEGAPVAAGTYDAVGRNDKVRSTKATFTLQ